jgi:hypothetical protein
MTADKATLGWWARLAERRQDRRQRRAWRRERRKGSVDPGAAGAMASSTHVHGQRGRDGPNQDAGGTLGF